MAKKKNWLNQLVSERYFVWAIVFAIIVGGALLAQISLASEQLDSEALTSSYLTIPHTTHPVVHKKR